MNDIHKTINNLNSLMLRIFLTKKTTQNGILTFLSILHA